MSESEPDAVTDPVGLTEGASKIIERAVHGRTSSTWCVRLGSPWRVKTVVPAACRYFRIPRIAASISSFGFSDSTTMRPPPRCVMARLSSRITSKIT